VRLRLKFPQDWVHENLGDVEVFTAQGYKLVPDLVFMVFPLVPRRELATEPLLLRGVAPGAEIVRAEPVAKRSRTGWPMTLLEADVRGAGHDEIRLLARYDVLLLAGAVLVRATNRARFEKHRADMVKLLWTARPDLTTDEPARIGELWDMS
jgi:hypothetical protein